MADKPNFDAMAKNRLEKDLTELQTLIASHFEKRKADDAELEELKDRIRQRKQDREDQLRIRHEREKRRLEEEREVKVQREEEEEKRRVADEEKKKQAIQNMSASYGGYLQRSDKKGNRRQTEREKKRKILTDRRRPLNVDHLSGEKIETKAKELQMFYAALEEERFNFEVVCDRQKYDVNQLRNRVQQYMGKYAKTKDSTKGIKTFSNVAGKKAAFK